MYNIWIKIKESEVEDGRAVWKGTEANNYEDGLGYEDYNTHSRFKSQGNNPDEMKIISLWGYSDPQVLIDSVLAVIHASSQVVGGWDTITGEKVAGIAYQAATALAHMPDKSNGEVPPTMVPATQVENIIVIAGQEKRDFS